MLLVDEAVDDGANGSPRMSLDDVDIVFWLGGAVAMLLFAAIAARPWYRIICVNVSVRDSTSLHREPKQTIRFCLAAPSHTTEQHQ